MNRNLIDIASIIIFIAFLEIHFFQFTGTDYPLYGLLKLVITIQLIVPCWSVAFRVIDKVNCKAKDNVLIVNLGFNALYSSENNKVDADFSTDNHLIAYQLELEKALNEMLRISLKNKGLFTTAPLVAIKVDENLLSEIEQKALINICISAGALDCIIVDSGASENDIDRHVKNTTLSNFA